jgi:hypothetical protein
MTGHKKVKIHPVGLGDQCPQRFLVCSQPGSLGTVSRLASALDGGSLPSAQILRSLAIWRLLT